jgi:nucleoside-diphosphate-sugar epimerase
MLIEKPKKVLIIGGTGYIGSVLYEHLKDTYEVETCDIEARGNYVNENNILVDYEELDKDFIRSFDSVILLAGHSTVAKCVEYPFSSIDNNIKKFIDLVFKLRKDQCFIYASSASVYGNTYGEMCSEECDTTSVVNAYDFAKNTIDNIIKFSNVNYYGLRFGTVCGYSKNIRNTVINAMYNSAINNNEIFLCGREKSRGILGIKDLCRAVESIIKNPKYPGIYNLSSFNTNMNDIAKQVSLFTYKPVVSVDKLEDERSNSPYNFKLDCSKFEDTFDFKFHETFKSILEALSVKNSCSV